MEVYEEDEMARALKDFISLDKDIESVKQMLSLKTDFNLEDCYRVFDVTGKGHINLRELEEAYNIYGLYPQKEELELVLSKYDKDNDGKLSFSEFCDMVVPRDKNYASLVINRKPYNLNTNFPRGEPFTPET
jgi:Ca2+-binding EF-hand superfamily protein